MKTIKETTRQLLTEVSLSNQQAQIINFMVERDEMSITAREALMDLDMTSATLASRICELQAKGFNIARQHRRHDVTGKRYVEYQLV